MSRLPVPGSDEGNWGLVLNDYLSQAHDIDGTLKSGAVQTASVADGAVTEAKLSPSLQTKVNTAASTTPDATTTSKGILQLAGDLGGTAAAPTVPGLAGKADNTAVVHLTGAETVAGVKTFSSSPVVPTPTNGTDAATKDYVDTFAASGTPDATSSATGKVQLAGDLGGTGSTAAAPVVTDASTYRFHKTATKEIIASDPVYGTPGTRAAFIAALDAAEALGKGTIVRLPAGFTVDVVSTLSMSGRSCQIIGAGAGVAGVTGEISVIKASAQSGPVIDFAGYVVPGNFTGKVTPLANVTIQGSNVADATKANSGIRMTAMSSAYFHDIAILQTGGPGLELAANPGNGVYLCDFERIIFSTPVGAKANDVPYFYANECNGNRFRGFGFRSILASGDVGASGAVVIEANASYAPYNNLFDGFWYEYLHPPINGSLFSHAGNGSTIKDFQFFDCEMEAGASGTSYFRLLAPGIADFGGNILSAVIPGDNGTTTHFDAGVDVRQSRNRIEGTRGYGGKNIVIASGVDYTYAHLAGAVSGSAGGSSAFVNNSAGTHNILIDELNGVATRGAYTVREGNTGPQFEDAATPTIGSVRLGNTGARVQVGAGSPEGVVSAPVGSLYLRTDGGAGTTLYIKETGTGNTGWAAK